MRTIKWTPVIVTIMIIALAITLSYVGCGGSSSSSSGSSAPAASVRLGVITTTAGLTVFNQTVALSDTDASYSSYPGFQFAFPGQANYWDLGSNFSLEDGGDDQFDGAMQLAISATNFVSDQAYSELTYMTPVLGAADGVIVAKVISTSLSSSNDGTVFNYSPISGVYSVALNAISDARVKQTINLAGATTPITLTWSDSVSLDTGSFTGEPAGSFEVNIRSITGTLLENISIGGSGTAATAVLSAYAGQTIVLSFEQRSSYSNCSLIDDVSIKGNNGTEYVTNGDFETENLNGWTTNSPQELQNVTSGPRVIEGLTVTRSFYTVPNKLWGRWVDVFENNTITDTCVTITYTTNLGSDSYGIVYTTTATAGKALIGWDGSGDDRDLGLVFGSADKVDFLSDDGLNAGNAGGMIYVSYNITVTAGSRVAIVNFVIMDGINTGETASDITAKATAIDAEAVKIANNFWTDVQYREGMTQKQIDAILNFHR